MDETFELTGQNHVSQNHRQEEAEQDAGEGLGHHVGRAGEDRDCSIRQSDFCFKLFDVFNRFTESLAGFEIGQHGDLSLSVLPFNRDRAEC